MQKKLKANLLETGLYFQKDPNPKVIEEMVANFDWNQVQPLDVSKRDGRYYVVDGQHRLFSIRKKYGINTEWYVPCNIIENLTEDEEIDLFVKLATKRRKVSYMEVFKGKYADGKGEKDIVTMFNIVNKNGLIIDWKENKKVGRIVAIKAMYGIYKEIPEHFEEYIKLLHKTWNGDIKSLQVPILKGLCEFMKRYGNEYDSKTFIKKLNKYSPDDIIREAKANKYSKTEIVCGMAILDKYNKGLKVQNRLESRF